MASISTAATVFIPRQREDVFAWVTDPSTSPSLKPSGPFAGIERIEMDEGQTLAKGVKRRVVMTDGTVLEEVIVAFDTPSRYAYGWNGGAKFPFSLLVRSGSGSWDFIEEPGGTRIVWTYTFGLTTPFAYPFALPIAALFRGWLQKGLDATRAELLA